MEGRKSCPRGEKLVLAALLTNQTGRLLESRRYGKRWRVLDVGVVALGLSGEVDEEVLVTAVVDEALRAEA
jgi:hypothetical protein